MELMPSDLLTKYDGRIRVFTRLVSERREKLMLAVVWRLPHWLIYWAVIRAAAHASRAEPRRVMGEITAVDVLKHWKSTP